MEQLTLNMEQLLAEARAGNKESQDKVMDAIYNTESFEQEFARLQPEDETWLSDQASLEGDARAMLLLLVGMDMRYERVSEEYIDDDTGEPFTFVHAMTAEGTLFPKNEEHERLHYDMLVHMAEFFDAPSLKRVTQILRYCSTRNYTPLLRIAADRGDKAAMTDLAETLYYGDGRNGIFIDRELAREFYERAGEEFPTDDDDDDTPLTTEYILSGNTKTLDGIRTTIDSLAKTYGTPDNEFGLFIPLGFVMKLLVGCPEDSYRGNILSLTDGEDGSLVLTAESDSSYPLLYALQQAFTNLKVEIKET